MRKKIQDTDAITFSNLRLTNLPEAHFYVNQLKSLARYSAYIFERTLEGLKSHYTHTLWGVSESYTLFCSCCGHGHMQTHTCTNKQTHTHSLSSTQTHTVPFASLDMCDLISDCVLQRSAKLKTLEYSRCSYTLSPSHFSVPSLSPPLLSISFMDTDIDIYTYRTHTLYPWHCSILVCSQGVTRGEGAPVSVYCYPPQYVSNQRIYHHASLYLAHWFIAKYWGICGSHL